MRTIPIVLIAAGLVLIWCGVTARNPIEVVKAVLTGEDVPEAGSLEVGDGSAPTDPLEQTPANPGPDGEFPLAPGEDFGGDFDVPPGTTLT